jgi:hypothetical protein
MQSPALQQVATGMHAVPHSFLPAPARLVSQPFDGSPSQSAKPLLQARPQVPLQVPLMALQQVAPHTTEPGLSAYEQLPPMPLQMPAWRHAAGAGGDMQTAALQQLDAATQVVPHSFLPAEPRLVSQPVLPAAQCAKPALHVQAQV